MRNIRCLFLLLVHTTNGFVNHRTSTSRSSVTLVPGSSALNMVSPTDMLPIGIENNLNHILIGVPSIMVSDTEAWVQPLATILGPFLNLFSFAMVGYPFTIYVI